MGAQPSPQQRELIGQLIRFGITGVALTLMVAGGYWVVATWGGVEPMLAMTLVYLVFTGVGYLLHSKWSFQGHGGRDDPGKRGLRFFAVNTIGFVSNQFFVWLLVHKLGGPTWWPVIPIVFLTPLLTFALNRRWVFA